MNPSKFMYGHSGWPSNTAKFIVLVGFISFSALLTAQGNQRRNPGELEQIQRLWSGELGQ